MKCLLSCPLLLELRQPSSEEFLLQYSREALEVSATEQMTISVEFSIHSVADDDTVEVEAEKGSTLLDVCQDNCVEITGICDLFLLCPAVCSGGGSCGSCHVILPKDLYDTVAPPNDLEKDLLTNVVFGVQPT